MPAEQLANAPSSPSRTACLKRTVEDAYDHVRVRGEISSFLALRPAIFSLKDRAPDRGRDLEVLPRPHALQAAGRAEVIAGKSTPTPALEIPDRDRALEPAGIGALMALMEERKKKRRRRLFEQRKQVARLPDVIGVVTSPTGAVIRDITIACRTAPPRAGLARRSGRSSAKQVAAASAASTRCPRRTHPRPIATCCAGGSLEDLWSFEESPCAPRRQHDRWYQRSATDRRPLIDFAADRRAPTHRPPRKWRCRCNRLFAQSRLAPRRVCWQRGRNPRSNCGHALAFPLRTSCWRFRAA
jgi:exodeoxyribonuclease VII large subunit